MPPAGRHSAESGSGRAAPRGGDERSTLQGTLLMLLVSLLSPGCPREVGTGEPEICDGRDNDGDGEVERGADCPYESYFCASRTTCTCA